jgi:hypothetical protein
MEALKRRNSVIVGLLLSKGASLNLSEKTETGIEIFPNQIAKDNYKMINLLARYQQNGKII